MSRDQTFALFCYGTLKRGLANHDRHCGGYLGVEAASVRGRLYHIPATGYPALVAPQEDVHATGTADYSGDARASKGPRTQPSPGPPPGPRVLGELFVLDDPGGRLPALDRLEGYVPGADSLYRRVLLPVVTDSGDVALAWAYSLERDPAGVHLPDGLWPSR